MSKTETSKSYDRLIQIFVDTTKEMSKYMGSIDGTLRAINDTNLLHKTSLDRQADILQKNTNSIEHMVKTNSAFMKTFNILLTVLVAALIILAGAEKALKFLPL